MKTLWCSNGFVALGVFVTMFLFRFISESNGLAFPIFLTLVVFLLLSLHLILLEKNVLGSLAAWSASVGIWPVIRGAFPMYCDPMLILIFAILVLMVKRAVDDEITLAPIILSESVFGLAILCLVYGTWVLEYYFPWVGTDTFFYFVSQRIH